MVFEIHPDRFGNPILKKVDRPHRNSVDGRGMWAPIGSITEKNIHAVVQENERQGLIVLIDEDGVFRALVLTD